MTNCVDYVQGSTPLLISIPHQGLHVPDEIKNSMTMQGCDLPDTDWHLSRLYGFAKAMGASVLQSRYSRYVVDLNRSPDNENLYPGLQSSSVVPVNTFLGEAIYQQRKEPDETEVKNRQQRYWWPYHHKLQQSIEQIKKAQGFVMLFEAHSIRSVCPLLFEGRLPDLNVGTDSGRSCSASFEKLVCDLVKSAEGYTRVFNGRFKGGYITRHYGDPDNDVHAVQLEIAQRNYMLETSPYSYNDALASVLQKTLKQLILGLLKWKPQG